MIDGREALSLPHGDRSGGRYQQQGAGAFTLCGKCNNDTGAWYARDFVDWCCFGGEMLQRTQGRPACIYVKDVYPLRVAKQILTMFCSVRGPQLVEGHRFVQTLLLNRQRCGMPDGLRLFVHYAVGGLSRQFGIAAHVDLTTGRTIPMSELVFPPFGYLLTYGEDPPDRRVLEITWFVHCRYDERRTLEMNLPLVPTVSHFPGDYRTKQELEDCGAENLRYVEAQKRNTE